MFIIEVIVKGGGVLDYIMLRGVSIVLSSLFAYRKKKSLHIMQFNTTPSLTMTSVRKKTDYMQYKSRLYYTTVVLDCIRLYNCTQ